MFGDSDDSKYKQILTSLLGVNKQRNRTTRYGGVCLKPFDEIKEIYLANSREFDLKRFQLKFIKLVRLWSGMVLPVPELSRLGYGTPGIRGNRGGTSSSTQPMMELSENKENINDADYEDDDAKEKAASGASQIQQLLRTKKPKAATGAAKDEMLRNDDAKLEFGNDDDRLLSEIDSEENEGALENLSRKRKAMMKNVKDPLEDCLAVAESARTRQRKSPEKKERLSAGGTKMTKSTLYQKKKSAHKVVFSDSEASDDDEDKDNDIAMSNVPDRYKQPKRAEPAPRAVPVQVARGQAAVKKRKKFTDTEDNAIKLGVERFGHGNWAEIKSYYCIDLKERSAVQIKDRYRTLTKE